MLTISTNSAARTCDGLRRRDFLQIGALGFTGFTLGHLLAARAQANQFGVDWARDKSVVLMYLSGGPTHIETFDPKMTAPAEYRSMTGETATRLPGVTFGGTFTGLAQRADRMAVVRSFHTPIGDHVRAHVHVLSGGVDRDGAGEKGFSMGALASRLRGSNHPETGMPTFSLLTETEVDGQYRNEHGRVHRGSSPGLLGPSFGPFEHRTGDAGSERSRRTTAGSSLAANMHLNIEAERFADRRALLTELDRLNREADASGQIAGFDKFNTQAVNLVLGGAADAFDFRREDPRTIERYDTSHVKIGHKTFRPSTMGHQLLVARRLCEAGCGFVTVHSAGWDMHADGNNPGILTGMQMLGSTLDKSVSAFLDDVAERGLSDKILLVIVGDFGRTPKVNARGGRDHWSRLGTVAFAGGGLRMGQVIGQSTRNADEPADRPVGPQHVLATIMHTLFDPGRLRLDSSVPRELNQLVAESEPISELFG